MKILSATAAISMYSILNITRTWCTLHVSCLSDCASTTTTTPPRHRGVGYWLTDFLLSIRHGHVQYPAKCSWTSFFTSSHLYSFVRLISFSIFHCHILILLRQASSSCCSVKKIVWHKTRNRPQFYSFLAVHHPSSTLLRMRLDCSSQFSATIWLSRNFSLRNMKSERDKTKNPAENEWKSGNHVMI